MSWQAAAYPALYARFDVLREDLYRVVMLSAAAAVRSQLAGFCRTVDGHTSKLISDILLSVGEVRCW